MVYPATPLISPMFVKNLVYKKYNLTTSALSSKIATNERHMWSALYILNSMIKKPSIHLHVKSCLFEFEM